MKLATANRTAAHSALKREILARLGARHDIRIFDNPRGFDRLTRVNYGLAPGATDLVGISTRGRWVALEVKTGNAVPMPAQKKFLAMINAFNGVGRVVRSVEDADQAADEACR